jgi:hypothetical protein
MLRALRSAPAPTVDNAWAPADTARLAEIHLDPPGPVPALGIGRWLGPSTPDLAADLLAVGAQPDSPVAMVELRHLENTAPARAGAMTAVPAPFLLHAVGLAHDEESRHVTEQGLSQTQAQAQPLDVGMAAASFADGRGAVAHGLENSALSRLAELRAAVDPQRRVLPSRILAPLEPTTPPEQPHVDDVANLTV